MFTESQVHLVVDGSSMELPIKKLSDDLLLEIFSVNASNKLTKDFHSITPVTTTRFSSQVCKHWRHLILGSSSLWGGLLNLDELIWASDKWRNEVLSRTKTAMLTVRIGGSPQSWRATSFLLKILNEEWSRIQHLEILLNDARWHVRYDDRWRSILRPTENLRSISLHFPVGLECVPEPLQSHTKFNVLFSGQAPSLRSVSIRHMDNPLPALQLSELRLGGQISPDIIMKSLSAIPSLETLEISSWHDAGFPHPQWPKISLPRLKYLITRGPFGACLLDHIIAPPGCGLDFGSPLFVADQDLSTDLQVLSRYCDGYFKTYNPTITLLLASMTFGFHTPREPNIPPFDIRIENVNRFSSMSSLFSLFLDCPFFGVPSILFLAGNGLAFLPSDPNFSKFIALLSSVRHMGTDPQSLRYLSQVPTESGVTFFPSLQSLHLVAIYPESVAKVTDFLLWLESAGGSIQSLYVGSGADLEDGRVNLSSLEQFSGLEMRWGSADLPSTTYICGSGTPERLNFAGSFPIRLFDERQSLQLLEVDSLTLAMD